MNHVKCLIHFQGMARLTSALLLMVPLLGVSAQAQGNGDINLHDSAFAAGGNGGVFPPAAFSGSERSDTASFTMAAPILSLPGRGLDLKLELDYDSGLYQNRWQPEVGMVLGGTNHRTDFVNFNLGFGQYVINNNEVICRNSPLTCGNGPVGFPPQRFWGPTYYDSHGVPYRYGDLSFGQESGKPTVTYPDGTKTLFGRGPYKNLSYTFQNGEWIWNDTLCRQWCDVYDWVYLPTKITDRNGNFITITYDDTDHNGAISSVTDTLGRVVKFHYGSNWWSITTPDNSPTGEHVIARFHLSTPSTWLYPCDPSKNYTASKLDFVVFPDTGMGWHYTYSPYGMIYRVEKMVGFSVDANDNPQGYSIAAVTEYNYPTAPGLCGIPTYNTRTDQWADQNGNLSAPIVHQFGGGFPDGTHQSITTVTAPDQTITETIRRYYPPQEHTSTDWQPTWDEGLVLQSKTTKNGKIYSQVNNNWGTATTPRGPRLYDVTTTDDAGHQKKSVFVYYDPPSGTNGLWDNVHTKTEYKFDSTTFDSSTEVRRTDYTYETSSEYLNRGLMKLVKSVKVFQGGSTLPLSEEDYTYDSGALTTYANLPTTYDQSTPSQRGNVTAVSANTNAASPGDGVTITRTLAYDIFGNATQSTDANNHTAQFDYTDSFSDGQVRNTYAYLTSASSAVPDPSGASGSASPLTENRVYDFYTGLVTSATDPNGQHRTLAYDSAWRLKQISQPDGGYTQFEYGDNPGNLFVRTLTLQQTTPTQSIIETRKYFNGFGQAVRSFQSEGGTWLAIDTKYDVPNRSVSVSNPYRVDSLDAAVNPTNNWTTSVYDPIGRIVNVTTPDGAQATSDYFGVFTLASDPANKKRLTRSDELGQITDVWEITTDSGAEPVTFGNQNLNGYHTQYYFDVLGNLRRVTQGTQQRFFSYDSLSRLIRVMNPEQEIRSALALNDPLTTNSGWTIAYDYDSNGNLRHRTDARGIVTTYAYDALDRLISRSYANDPSGTPSVSFVYDLPAKGLLTSVASSVSTCQYSNYDPVGRPKTVTEQIGSQSYVLNYEYDLAGHVKTLRYPSNSSAQNHRANYSFDAAGRLQNFTGTLGDGSFRNYAIGIAYDSSGGWGREQFGTTVPLYNKRHYNNRQMLYDMRVSTVNDDTDWNRGKIVDYYSLSNPTEGGTGSDTNGSLYRQQHWIPTNDAIADWSYTQYDYSYDALNRIKSSTEFQRGTDWIRPPAYVQTFDYDLWGNRTINSASWGVNNKQFDKSDAPNTNRLYAPGDIPLPMNQRQMRYDEAGNLSYDVYTGEGTRVYDAEGRIIQAWANGQWQYYGYDGQGRRIKRRVNNIETWQIYGLGGDLIAEYASTNPNPLNPQKEYGYRNGQLLITAEPGTTSASPPSNLATVPTSSYVALSWFGSASKYRVERKGAAGSFQFLNATTGTSLNDFANPGFAYLYRVCTADANNNCTSGFSNVALGAVLNFTTDPTITSYSENAASATTIKAAHITELRTAVNAVRSLAGLPTVTTPNPAIGDYIFASNINDLRTALNEALTAPMLQIQTSAYTDNTIVGSSQHPLNATPIKAVHIRELRQRATSGIGNGGSGGSGSSFQIHWLVTDQLGTPRMIFDQGGGLTVSNGAGNYVSGVIRHDYLPFGEELPVGLDGRTQSMGYGGADGVRQQFTEYERDETRLDFAQARHYSSIIGRFTRPDPMMASASLTNPQSWNRYTYCGNDPLDFIDPSGLDWYKDNFEEGTTHPRWFDGAPPPDPGRWAPWYQFVYWNVETQTWWWLNPHAFQQGPASSEMEAYSVVGHFETDYADAHYQPPTPAYLADFAAEWNTRYVPAMNQSMNYMGAYMFLFTGPTGEIGSLTSLGLRASEATISSGTSALAAEMTIVRTIQRGEKVADIINEGKSLTFTTGHEHALVTLASGERALVSGNQWGINFGNQVTRIFGHTHPFQFSASGVSAADRAALEALGQRSSWLFEHGKQIKFGPN